VRPAGAHLLGATKQSAHKFALRNLLLKGWRRELLPEAFGSSSKLVEHLSVSGENCAELTTHLKAFYNKPSKTPIKANGGNSSN